MKNVRDALMVGYDSAGKTVRRPLSPHLQVYSPQMTSILSIMNRVTGIAVSVGTLLLVWWLVAAAAGPSAFDMVQWFVASPVGLFVVCGWTVSLMFHFWNGIRHLAWDAGFGFDLSQAYASGWAVVIATAVSSLLILAAGLLLMGR